MNQQQSSKISLSGGGAIELRSEKVRNIIGQVPSVLLCYGISIIGLAFCVLICLSAIVPYHPAIDTRLEIKQDETDKLHFTVNIRENEMKDFAQFSSVTCERASALSLPSAFKIHSVLDTLQLGNDGAWYRAVVVPKEPEITPVNLEDNPISFPAKIMLKKKSLLIWMLKKVVK